MKDFKIWRRVVYGIKTRDPGPYGDESLSNDLKPWVSHNNKTGIKCIVTLCVMAWKQWVVVSILRREVWQRTHCLLSGGRAGLLWSRGSLSCFWGITPTFYTPFGQDGLHLFATSQLSSPRLLSVLNAQWWTPGLPRYLQKYLDPKNNMDLLTPWYGGRVSCKTNIN